MQKFIIEREIPERRQPGARAAQGSGRQVQRKCSLELAPDIQWVELYVAANKTFCVYLAKDEALIRKHAELSGFPANKITADQQDDRPDHRFLQTAITARHGRRLAAPPARARGWNFQVRLR